MLIKVKDHLVLYGGMGSNSTVDTSSAYIFNLDTYTWFMIEGGTNDISSRSNFAYEYVNSTNIILFGGLENSTGIFLDEVVIWNLEKMQMNKIEVTGDYPEARAGHMMCRTKNKDLSKLLLVGGINSIIVSMDIYFLIIDKITNNSTLITKSRKTEEEKEVEKIANDYLFEMNKKNNKIRDLILFETQRQLKFKKEYNEAETIYNSTLENHNETVKKKQTELDSLKKLKEHRLKNIDALLEKIKMEEVRCDLKIEKIKLLQQTFKDVFMDTSTLDKVLSLAATGRPSEKSIKDLSMVDIIKENKAGLKNAKDKLQEYLAQMKHYNSEFETTQTSINKSIEAHKAKTIKKFPVFEKMYKINEPTLSVIDSSENDD